MNVELLILRREVQKWRIEIDVIIPSMKIKKLKTMKIFIIGSPRSGTNLLRVMLGQLPLIAAPHPPHIIHRLMPLMPTYGDLKQNFSLLVEDACRLVELNYVQWESVELNRKGIIERCSQPNLLAVAGAIYDIYAERWGKSGWCNKSMYNVNYAGEIAEFFSDAKFIYMYRDGRDVALSNRKGIVGEKHYYHIAKDWHDIQQLGLKFAVGNERCKSVSYEELLSKPEQTCESVCKFLGVDYTPQMMEFHRSDESRMSASSSSILGNITKPLMVNNTRKFVKETNEEDLRIFESVAGESLDALGYDRVLIKPGQELQFTEEEIAEFAIENKKLKEDAWAAWTEDDRHLRERQLSYLDEIVRRNSLTTV